MEPITLSVETSVSDLTTSNHFVLDHLIIDNAESLDNAVNLISCTPEAIFTPEHVKQLEEKLQKLKKSLLAQDAIHRVTDVAFLSKTRADLLRKSANTKLYGRARYSLFAWENTKSLSRNKLSKKQRSVQVPQQQAVDLSTLSPPEQNIVLLLCLAKVDPLTRSDFSIVYKKCAEHAELGRQVRETIHDMLKEKHISTLHSIEQQPAEPEYLDSSASNLTAFTPSLCPPTESSVQHTEPHQFIAPSTMGLPSQHSHFEHGGHDTYTNQFMIDYLSGAPVDATDPWMGVGML